MTNEQLELAKKNRNKANECSIILEMVGDSECDLLLKATVKKSGAFINSLSVPDWLREAIEQAAQERMDSLDAEFKEL